MAQTIDGVRKMIVKSAIEDYVNRQDNPVVPGTPEYADLMQNVENQVQSVLKDMGEVKY